MCDAAHAHTYPLSFTHTNTHSEVLDYVIPPTKNKKLTAHTTYALTCVLVKITTFQTEFRL